MADDINILQAVLAIDSTAQVTVYPDGTMKWNTTPIAEEDILAKQAELQAEYDALEYSRDRQEEYPSMADQLDYIYHNGIAKWKSDMVKPVKDKHPKP